MKKTAIDWRKLPRKPTSQKRTESFTFRLTRSENENLRKNAADADMTIVDYVVEKCCK